MNHKSTYYLLTVTVALWASSFVGIRAGVESYTPGAMALFRFIIASAVMLLIYSQQTKKNIPSKVELATIFLLGSIGFGLYNLTLNAGEVTVHAGITGFVIGQIPVVSIILARFSLNEKLTKLGWVGLAISLAGMVVIVFGERQYGEFNHGIWLLIIAVFSGAIYTVFHKPLLQKFNAIQLVSWAMWSGTVVLLGYSNQLIHEITHASLSSTLWVIYLGVFPAAIGYICWAKVLKDMPASKASSYLYWMPIIATLLGWLLLGEVPQWLSLVGGFIALGGAILIKVKP